MELTRNFTGLSKHDAGLAGGKGASLGEMTQAGIPVPPGFVVLADSFEQFIRETDLVQEIDAILAKVDHKTIHTVESASEQIRELILNAEMPKDIAEDIKKQFAELNTKHVAVRSSATAEDGKDHAWAGQLESYLNTTEADLLEKVKRCWSSLFTPRAIFYRFEKGLHSTKISVAVVVQKMVESEVSGIAFSVHPVTEDHNQLIIEAGFGLGEAIVSGSVTPDSYVVEKEPRKIIDINISTQSRGLYRADHASAEHGNNEWRDIPEPKASSQVLNESQIFELAQIIVNIENHYGFPCDIEWAYEAGKFYIVQSRPITTLSNVGTSKTSVNKYNPDDYARMFSGGAFLFIFSDVFMKYYKALGVLSVQDEKTWMSLLPKATQAQTLKDGKKLYETKELYQEYKAGFDAYIKESSAYFESILKKEKLDPLEVEKALSLIARHFYFYSKTEFFYTDSVDHDKMVISVQEFDKLKLDGRSYLNKLLFEANGYGRSLIRKIAEQTGTDEADLLLCYAHELVEVVKTGKKVPADILETRHLYFQSQDDEIFGDASKELSQKFLSLYREVSNVIKGKTAYKGRVTGKAFVFPIDFKNFHKMSEAVHKMKEGEILIAETTAPEIIQACKKAAAIVTNQGGMLSHAAIISRELRIPCVIGTDKDVILNIKTGDEVEVDADGGVIRILK